MSLVEAFQTESTPPVPIILVYLSGRRAYTPSKRQEWFVSESTKFDPVYRRVGSRGSGVVRPTDFQNRALRDRKCHTLLLRI